MQTVELQVAYHWHCERCGESNFALPQKAELTPEEREGSYRLYHDLDAWQALPEDWADFELVEIPETVRCEACGTEFATIDERSA